MELGATKAANILDSVDKRLRDTIQRAKDGEGSIRQDLESSLNESLKDTVELSPESQNLQGASALSSGALNLFGDLANELEPLLSLIRGSLGGQNGFSIAAEGGSAPNLEELRQAFGVGEGGVPADIQKQAQELLDGYLSVENTSERIFSFAVSFFDGSEDRAAFAERFQGFIDEGFRQAEEELGGLAQISIDTYKTIRERFEVFVAEGQSGEGTDGGNVAAASDSPTLSVLDTTG